MCLLFLATKSHPTLLRPHDCSLPESSVHGFLQAGKNIGVGCHALLQGIFPTQGLNLGLPYCRQILYCLSYQGNPYLSICGHIYMCVCVCMYKYTYERICTKTLTMVIWGWDCVCLFSFLSIFPDFSTLNNGLFVY